MQIMVDNFDHRLNSEMRERAKEENLSIFELVTMASLVEKEAKFAEDRPIIADVFFKRLENHMMLQSDATIQYALDEHKEEFSIEDTKLDSPYNTYQHEGLTQGQLEIQVLLLLRLCYIQQLQIICILWQIVKVIIIIV